MCIHGQRLPAEIIQGVTPPCLTIITASAALKSVETTSHGGTVGWELTVPDAM